MSDGRRSPAEWVTFGVSALVLLAVVVLIAAQMRGPREPAAPTAAIVGPTRHIGGQHLVDVAVTNEGDVTAANVQVSAQLVIAGSSPTDADQTIDFLAGDETQELVFVFADDPGEGELTVVVSSFAVP